MQQTLVTIGLILVVGWIAFRVIGFLWRRLRRKRQAPPVERIPCPKCGSTRLDDLSDRESGYCLSCKHVWGVDKP